MKKSLPGLMHFIVLALPALFLLIILQAEAVELNIPRQGVVKNVPLQEPYNGCLIVRDGPGMEYPASGHVVNGDTVTIDGTSGNWFKISAPKTGYVWASYITVTDFDTVDSSTLGKPLTLEIILEGDKPETRAQKLPERQKILEENRVYQIDIEREINP